LHIHSYCNGYASAGDTVYVSALIWTGKI